MRQSYGRLCTPHGDQGAMRTCLWSSRFWLIPLSCLNAPHCGQIILLVAKPMTMLLCLRNLELSALVGLKIYHPALFIASMSNRNGMASSAICLDQHAAVNGQAMADNVDEWPL